MADRVYRRPVEQDTPSRVRIANEGAEYEASRFTLMSPGAWSHAIDSDSQCASMSTGWGRGF
jgi:hypothetical protein